MAGSWPRVYDEVRKPDRHPDPDEAMVQASVSESRVASVSPLRLKTHSRDLDALEWRESESRIRAVGPFDNRSYARHLFSCPARHARGSRETHRGSTVSSGSSIGRADGSQRPSVVRQRDRNL